MSKSLIIMKHRFYLINSILLFIFLYLTLSITEAQITYDCELIKNIAQSEKYQYGSKKLVKSAYYKYTGSNYDLKYHKFNLNIDPDTFYIKGSVKSIFTITKDTAHLITFDLNGHLTVDSVKSGKLNLAYLHSTDTIINLLYIYLDKIYTLNQIDSVTVYYHGVPINEPGFGSFVKGFHKTNSVKVPIIWSLSEPYGAKDWWPCKSTLDDKIDSIDMFITTPSQYKAASNGLLINETKAGIYKTFHWKHRYPIATYLIAVAVTNYAVYSDFVPLSNNKNLQILNYVFPEDTSLTKPATNQCISFIQLYNKLFSPYPFLNEKYGHAEFGWGGGMEHQTMTFLGNKAFNTDIISHELAHQWFGDKVTCNNWTDLWLNEGFATYSTGLCYEYLDPTHYWWNIYKKLTIQTIVSKSGGSVYIKDTNNLDTLFSSRITYQKGSMLLHMIRWIIGDSNFFHSLRNYINDTKLAYNFANTRDLKTHFEQESGIDLTEFFNEWYYGEGYPTYNINIVKSFNNNVMLTFNQNASFPASVNLFKMPVPIRFKGEKKDTLIIFQDSLLSQSFNINPGFYIDSIFFDPDMWLIAKSNITVVNSILDKENDLRINVYPNPARNKCYINYIDLKIDKIVLVDASGKIINTFPKLIQQTGSITVNLNKNDKGVYYFKVYTDKSVIVKKIIKI